MKLLTQEIKKALPPLYATEKVPTNDKRVIVKFFTPDSNWTWYAVEGEQLEDGDWHFFGLMDGFEREWGYFLLSELATARGPLGLAIERDRHLGHRTIKEIFQR